MRAEVAHTLSAQEPAIESGTTVLHGTATDWILRMYQAMRTYGPPRVALDRTVPKSTAGRSAKKRRSHLEYFPSLGW
jgi:hypothetical protein